VKEADSHRSEDDSRREAVEARNHLDTLIYNTEKLVSENGDKLPASDKTALESAISEAKKTLENRASTPAELKAAADTLQKASYKIAEVLYKQAGPPEGAPPGAASSPSGKGADEVIDAEVVEEKK
jgi:molecular chaperone DnaK